MTHKAYRYTTLFILLITIVIYTLHPLTAQSAPALRIDANSKPAIVLPPQPILSEQTAARELQHYLARITGAQCRIVTEGQQDASNKPLLYVGPTQFTQNRLRGQKAFGDEEWLMQTAGDALILTGGRPRGTLYAVYHFLEEIGGVRWWTPWEELVPQRNTLAISALNKRGKPAFRYRDIYKLYGLDDGRFAARSRLNLQGEPIGAAYGGGRDYGPPDQNHTFYLYIDPKKYYDQHPDWFVIRSTVGASPTAVAATPYYYVDPQAPQLTTRNSGLALSNPGMRQEFLRLLRENIRSSRQTAIEKGLPLPDIYEVSQNDSTVGFISGPEDEKIVQANGGAQSALLLDFLNYLSDGIKDEFPDVRLGTLAYFHSEQAPTKIKARDNIIVRLTDTTSNVVLPVTAERNRELREKIEAWSKACKTLRIWDYGITYSMPQFPQPTMHTYPADLQFFAQHNVEGLFIEVPNRGAKHGTFVVDMRDMKLWVLCKMLEDPYQDYNRLIRTFTDGYYGAAAPQVRQYIELLETSAQKIDADIEWFSYPVRFRYLNLEFQQQAELLLEQAATNVAGDPVLSRRVRTVRASVDFAVLKLWPKLTQSWFRAGHSQESFPLNRDLIAERYLQTRTEVINLWYPQALPAGTEGVPVPPLPAYYPSWREGELKRAADTVHQLTAHPAFSPVPEKFKQIPASELFLYSPLDMWNHQDIPKVIADTEAESGITTRLEIPENQTDRYKLPMGWGLYDDTEKVIRAADIKAAQVPGPGYHWYPLGETRLTANSYLYFFWSWLIQNAVNDPFNPADPNAKYEIWVNIKFEGPIFPHGREDQKNTIFVERVALVRK